MLVKRILLKIIYLINYKVLMKNNILMESNPDYSDNSKLVFDELVRRGVNKKNKIIWFVKNPNNFSDIKIKNVYFYKRYGNIILKLRYYYYLLFSKYIIDCNDYIKKINKNQFRLHLTHGAPFKDANEYASNCGDLDYIVCLSDFFSNYLINSYGVLKNQLLITGFPRNDLLFTEDEYFKKIYKRNNEKVIVWMPTYRNKFENNKYISKINTIFPFSIPCIENKKELLELNNILKKNNIILLIKFHPSENIDDLIEYKLSNVIIIDDSIFVKTHSTIYNLLSISDGLITDYSSIYHDYLLIKKPIGLAIPDLQDYTKKFGLFFNDLINEIQGEFIYNFKDLKSYIYNIKNGISVNYNKSLNTFHKFQDPNSAIRVVDFFIKKTRCIEGDDNE